MKKLIYFSFISVLIFAAAQLGSTETSSNPLIIFRNKVCEYDQRIYDNKFTNNDALPWWKIADDLVVSLYNNHLNNPAPLENLWLLFDSV